MILVSACLIGLCTRYDGERKLVEGIRELVARGEAIPVCPEQLGGLPTPRPPADFVGGDGAAVLRGAGRLLNDRGEDVTAQFVRGAEETLALATAAGAARAIFKERSPSCGCREVFIDGELRPGMGVAAALLTSHGIAVESEEDWLDKSS